MVKKQANEYYFVASIPQTCEVEVNKLCSSHKNVMFGATHLYENTNMVGGYEATMNDWWDCWIRKLSNMLTYDLQTASSRGGCNVIVIVAISGGGEGCAREREFLSGRYPSGQNYKLSMGEIPVRYIEMSLAQFKAAIA
mmetsp:Transcript_14517/g.31584  ORF Transcript_14517/g.31584 Transcript_14517/m.31584 type:complete len:139 (-) Transcript_14517:852-1268(-)